MLNSPRVTDDPASEVEAYRVTDDPAFEVEAYQPTPTQRAQTLCDLGRFAAAAEAASQAIADEPRNSHAWCLMAQAQLGQDRAPAALVAAQAACRLEPAEEAPPRLATLGSLIAWPRCLIACPRRARPLSVPSSSSPANRAPTWRSAGWPWPRDATQTPRRPSAPPWG